MALNQNDADFFRPLWRRIAATAVITAWCAYETFFSHDQMWIAITAAGLVYCVWNFFLRYPKDQPGSTGSGTPTAALSAAPDDTDDSSPPTPPKA